MPLKLQNLCRRSAAAHGGRTRVSRTHYSLLVGGLAAVFGFHLWLNFQRYYAPLRGWGYDFVNFITLGRAFIEHHRLPTFLFPGKTYGAPAKPFLAFLPGLLLGYQDWIPPVTIAVYNTFIFVAVYLIARRMIAASAGLVAMILCAALDPFMATRTFQPAWGFDVMVLLGLSLGLCAIHWGEVYRLGRRQPSMGFAFCTGCIAGLSWYTHPLGIIPVLATGIFLALAMGTKVFTLRLPLAAVGAALGSLPVWIFCARNGLIFGDWQEYSDKCRRSMSLLDFLFSRKGYPWFLFSPSGHSVMRWFLLSCLVVVTGMFVCRLVRRLAAVDRTKTVHYLRTGLPVPTSTYPVILSITSVVVLFLSSGMSQTSAPSSRWSYGIELWFWLMIAGAYVLYMILSRSRVAGGVIIAVLAFFLYRPTITSLGSSMADGRREWRDTKDDAGQLLASGHRLLLTSDFYDYALFALGPPGLCVAERRKPWVKSMAEQVENAESIAVLGELRPATLGPQRWMTTALRTCVVHHSFTSPSQGSLLPNSSWHVLSEKETANAFANLHDDDFSTAWTGSDPAPGRGRMALTFVLDRPRSLCRICLYLQRTSFERRNYGYPQGVTVTGERTSGEWVVLTSGAGPDGYFWDGGRLYYGTERKRFDIHFSPCKVRKLRVVSLETDSYGRKQRVSEVYLFETAADKDRDVDVDGLVAYAQECGTKTVYADRFVSAQFSKKWPGARVWRPPWLRREAVDGPSEAGIGGGLQVMPSTDVLVVCDAAVSTRLQDLLEREELPGERRDFGAYTAFYVSGQTGGHGRRVLVWNGMCLGHYTPASERRLVP